MSNQNEVLPKLLATSEFRALSNMGKAVKLVQEHNYSIRKAADLLNLKKSVLHRAIKLAMNGKSVQPTGRPPILNSSEKENVIRNINKNIDSKELTTYKQIRRMVI
jgi:transposase-like protein